MMSPLLIKKRTLRDKDVLVLGLIPFYSRVDIILKCQNKFHSLGALRF